MASYCTDNTSCHSCLHFYVFFISHSAVSGMDDLHDYAIHIDQNDSSPITFQVDPSMLFPQINDQLAQTKQLFMIKSLAVTIVVILISSLSTWFLTRKSLAPLRSLSKKFLIFRHRIFLFPLMFQKAMMKFLS